MKAIEAYVTWQPSTGLVRVVHESEIGHIVPGWSWVGVCRGEEAPSVTQHEQEMMMFINFHTLVVRDGILPSQAHRAFLAIDEYCSRIAADIQGAESKA